MESLSGLRRSLEVTILEEGRLKEQAHIIQKLSQVMHYVLCVQTIYPLAREMSCLCFDRDGIGDVYVPQPTRRRR